MNEQQILEKAQDIVSFKSHLLVYILVNLLLFGVDFYGNGLINWAFFPLLGWGHWLGFLLFFRFQSTLFGREGSGKTEGEV